jgi:hypothetical protein
VKQQRNSRVAGQVMQARRPHSPMVNDARNQLELGRRRKKQLRRHNGARFNAAFTTQRSSPTYRPGSLEQRVAPTCNAMSTLKRPLPLTSCGAQWPNAPEGTAHYLPLAAVFVRS